MQEHRAFRQASGAAGVLQERDVAFFHLGPLRRRRGQREQVLQRNRAAVRRDRVVLDRRRAEFRIVTDDQVIEQALGVEFQGAGDHARKICGHHDARAGIFQFMRKLALGIERRHVHDASARLQHREEHHRMHRRIREIKSDRGSRLHAERNQPRGGAGNQIAQLFICRAPVTVFERVVFRVGRDGTIEEFVHRARTDRGRRIDARGIRLFPRIRAAVTHDAFFISLAREAKVLPSLARRSRSFAGSSVLSPDSFA